MQNLRTDRSSLSVLCTARRYVSTHLHHLCTQLSENGMETPLTHNSMALPLRCLYGSGSPFLYGLLCEFGLVSTIIRYRGKLNNNTS